MGTKTERPHPSVDFDEIFERGHGAQSLMGRPVDVQASNKFIHQVQLELEIEDRDEATRIADWAARKMDRFGALRARPVFDDEGNGPQCSYCDTSWPLCGHHHWSAEFKDEQDEQPGGRPR